MRWLKRLLIRYLGDALYTEKKLDVEAMNKWLYVSYEDFGFKNYYTMRKKNLVSLLALGIEGKEMYKTLGRLEELQMLGTNIHTAYQSALDKKEKEVAKLNKK